jgi:hypothetical protein
MAIEACPTCESIGFSDHYSPSMDYLFAKQVYDDSTQEMLYGHAILQRGCGPARSDVLILGGHVKRETNLMTEAAANFRGSRS